MVDLNAVEEDSLVSVPGLFRPSRPTLFSVLGEAQRREQAEAELEERPGSDGRRHAFGGSSLRRR